MTSTGTGLERKASATQMSIVLSCPSCSTKYRANPQAIGANGRRVRCASCAHVWTAELDNPADLPALEPAPVEAGSAQPDAEAEVTEPVAAYRARQEAKRRTMSAAVAGGAWGALVAAWALMLVGAWFFRVDIVNAWPQSTSAYAAVGVDVNPYGFEVGELTITRESEHGVPLLIIEGSIRNFDRRRRDVPGVRAILRDEAAHSLLEWNVALDRTSIRAGETLHFRTIASDPPPASAEAEITLVDSAGPHEAEDHPAPETADADASHDSDNGDH